MEEHVPPDIFYNGLRHFLSGYTQNAMAKQGGIIFEGNDHLFLFFSNSNFFMVNIDFRIPVN